MNTPTTEQLAAHGGPKTVTAERPVNYWLGPNEIGEEEIAAVTAVLREKNLFRFMKEPKNSPVAQFESLFAEMTGARHVLAVNSGTSALIAGLVGIGVGQGDEVLIPGYTYTATAAAVLALGAHPVITEIDESLTIDPNDIASKVSPRTKAIIPVHMRGKPCNMAAIVAAAEKHGLRVLEDVAQANGGTYRGTALGLLGDAGAYSLQHFKVITAGEGGAIITNNKSVLDRAAIYHDSAYAFWMEGTPRQLQAGTPVFFGENYRLSEVHGAIALEQLKKRDRILTRCRSIKRKFITAITTIPGATPEASNDDAGDCGISAGFLMENAERAKSVAELLKAEGVQCGTRFSKQVPDRHVFYHWEFLMEKSSPHANGFPLADSDLRYTRDMCPQTLSVLERGVFLPVTQIMSDVFVDQTCQAIEKVARHLKS